MPCTDIENLSAEALLRAYNEMAAIRTIEGIKGPVSKEKLLPDVGYLLEMVAQYYDVTIKEDGEVVAVRLPLDQVTKLESMTSRIRREQAEARVSPGIARMRARLGVEGTEELRSRVVTDGDASLVAAAARPGVVPLEEARDAILPSAVSSADETAEGMSVIEALALRKLTVPDLHKRLARELRPEVREVIREVIKVAQSAQDAATKNASSVPPPRRAAAPRQAPSYSPTDVIRLKVAGGVNPKKSTAGVRFAQYKDGMTVAEYTAAIGGSMVQAYRDLSWDTSKGWISVAGASLGGG